MSYTFNIVYTCRPSGYVYIVKLKKFSLKVNSSYCICRQTANVAFVFVK